MTETRGQYWEKNVPVVAFDCDGTLRHSVDTAIRELEEKGGPGSWSGDDLEALVDMPRHDVVKMLKDFWAARFAVVVHSGSGAGHAQHVVDTLELNGFVDLVEAKDSRKTYDICVDDMKVTLGKVNIRV